MARQARQLSSTGIYHIVMRGINRQDIFYENDDYERFLDTIKRIQADNFKVYGFCLMSNHIHLLIHEQKEKINQIMKRIGTSYAWFYNRKYQRSGHVFQGRYKSECVEDDGYLLTVIRYIHNNPKTAGIVKQPEEYPWSSIHAYYGQSQYLNALTDPSFILNMLADEPKEAIHRFRNHMKHKSNERCLDHDSKTGKSDEEVKEEIESLLDGQPVSALQSMEKQMRDEILRQIKVNGGASQRQIARITGLNQNIVFKA